MSIESIMEKIKEIIEDIADISADEVSLESSLIDDLDLSSIEVMSIISNIEKEFSINVSESELLEISTVRELVELVKNKI